VSEPVLGSRKSDDDGSSLRDVRKTRQKAQSGTLSAVTVWLESSLISSVASL
jgi:hypothetical protein